MPVGWPARRGRRRRRRCVRQAGPGGARGVPACRRRLWVWGGCCARPGRRSRPGNAPGRAGGPRAGRCRHGCRWWGWRAWGCGGATGRRGRQPCLWACRRALRLGVRPLCPVGVSCPPAGPHPRLRGGCVGREGPGRRAAGLAWRLTPAAVTFPTLRLGVAPILGLNGGRCGGRVGGPARRRLPHRRASPRRRRPGPAGHRPDTGPRRRHPGLSRRRARQAGRAAQGPGVALAPGGVFPVSRCRRPGVCSRAPVPPPGAAR